MVLLELNLGLFSIQNCEKQSWYLDTHLMDFYHGSLSRLKVKKGIVLMLKICSVEKILASQAAGHALAVPAPTEKLMSVSHPGRKTDNSLEFTD